MSLLRRPIRNHPQQVATRGADDETDDRWTPLHLWIPWNDRFRFTLDVAASDENHLCDRYFTRANDGLRQSWAIERVWCNPPYSDLPSWVAKARHETERGLCPLVVMLVPANRTEQRWWQEHIEPHRDRGGALSVEFLPRRINFARRDNLMARYHGSAPFGCALLVWDADHA